MKSYKNNKGIVVRGVSILEQILASRKKTESLNEVLETSSLQIAPNARPDRKREAWVV